jgi:hypothetical protein
MSDFNDQSETSAVPEPSEVLSDELNETKSKRPSNGTIVLAALFAAAIGGLVLMHFRAGPATASAATEASKAVNTFLGDGQKNLASMQANLADTDKLVEQFKQFPAAAQVPLEDLQRNPFSETKGDAKPTEAAESSDRKAKLDAAMKRVGTLRLQSIMFGEARRSCMIDGKFRAEGDTWDDFTVDKIQPASVIVKTGGFRFELKVAK